MFEFLMIVVLMLMSFYGGMLFMKRTITKRLERLLDELQNTSHE